MNLDDKINLEFKKLDEYLEFYIDRLAYNYKPFFFYPCVNFNEGVRNPHALNHWHGISKPHGKFITMKFLNRDLHISSKEEFEQNN